MDLINDLQMLISQLDYSVKSLRETGTAYAAAERDYKIKLRVEALALRTEKSMPVTLINQIIFGVPSVANLRFDRDIKEAVYKANQESINAIKLKIRVLESQIAREWGQAKQ